MANKTTRALSNSLRVLIAAGSIGAFLGGWALLAHSPNSYENAQAAPLDAPVSNSNTQLAPLPTPRARNSQNVQPSQSDPGPQLLPNTQSQPQFGSPFRQRRMRTAGS